MREKFNPLIKSCANWTVFTAETKSIGLPADTAFGEGRWPGALLFARLLDYLIMTQNLTSVYRDLEPSRLFYRDSRLNVHLPVLTKNAAPRSASWRIRNSLNRRVVRCYSIAKNQSVTFREFILTNIFYLIIETLPSTNYFLT